MKRAPKEMLPGECSRVFTALVRSAHEAAGVAWAIQAPHSPRDNHVAAAVRFRRYAMGAVMTK